MSWLPVVLTGVGAAIGAPLRYLTDRAIQARHDTVFPWGTFTVFTTVPRRLPTLRLAVPVEQLKRRTDLLFGKLVELPVTW